MKNHKNYLMQLIILTGLFLAITPTHSFSMDRKKPAQEEGEEMSGKRKKTSNHGLFSRNTWYSETQEHNDYRRAAFKAARRKIRKHYGSKPLSKKIVPNECSINLVWINKNRIDGQEFIFPLINESNDDTVSEIDKDSVLKRFFNPIFGWAIGNPETSISVWYDSEMTTENAVDKTQKFLNEEMPNYKIILKDIRTLDLVKENPTVFSEKTNVYFRADLLRLIILMDDIKNNDISYSIYTDFRVKPLNFDALFNPRTVSALAETDYCFGRGFGGGTGANFENGFYIIGNNPYIIAAINFALIECAIKAFDVYKLEIPADYVYAEHSSMLSLAGYLAKRGILSIAGKEFNPFEESSLKKNLLTEEIKTIYFNSIINDLRPRLLHHRCKTEIMPTGLCYLKTLIYEGKPFHKGPYNDHSKLTY